ncbi:MAG: hypothetical protein QNK23_17715 [Crocinitomicaceae bacterium]|nr:hypothetical protein [Crocinitomicaceae bacterium]
MNSNITKIIDQYLAGELSPEDTKVFEERMESNPELKQEVEIQRSVMEGAERASNRTDVQKIGKKYHFTKFIKWGAISLSAALILAVSSYYLFDLGSDSVEPIPQELIEQMDESAQIEELPTHYFQIPEEGAVVISEEGTLLSVPSDAFLLNGEVYNGISIVQLQEANDALDIITSGLSTTSGDNLLETQGMYGVQGFTVDGDPLEFNPEVGVYVQVPVDGYKADMQLYDGKKLADGSIDWQDPEPLEKLPVPVDMSKLDFYPVDYENYLDELKWSQGKIKRDSLYLSFEEYTFDSGEETMDELNFYFTGSGMIPERKITQEENEYLYEENPPIDFIMTPEEAYRLAMWMEGPNWEDFYGFWGDGTDYYDSTEAEDTTWVVDAAASCESDMAGPNHILPSKVLAFWNPKFNNTNLSTREFELRMRAIHNTCNNAVLEKYTNNLDKKISDIDREVVAMGYTEFEVFAEENVGALNPNNPHIKHLMNFYEQGIEQMKKVNYRAQNAEEERRSEMDEQLDTERTQELTRSIELENQAFNEECGLNLDNVYKQLGYTKGFTITGGSGNTGAPNAALKNIDKQVIDATIARNSVEIVDPKTGKTAELTYNEFNFTVANHEKYRKLFAYIFPHELNSYQRIDGTNGVFDYPLNNDILYDFAVVGLTEDGYEYFQKQTLRSGSFGTIDLEIISDVRLEASIQQLNKKRNANPVPIQSELNWLITEREYYEEEQQREEMDTFRYRVAATLFPCMEWNSEALRPGNDACGGTSGLAN